MIEEGTVQKRATSPLVTRLDADGLACLLGLNRPALFHSLLHVFSRLLRRRQGMECLSSHTGGATF